ncbi:MAG: hypothetical protein ACXVXE_15475 [Nocardioidaceae bacterium]
MTAATRSRVTGEGRHRTGARTPRPHVRTGARRAHASRRRSLLAPLLVGTLLVGAFVGLRSAGLFPSEPSARATSSTGPKSGPVAAPLARTEVHLGDAGGMHVVSTLTFATPQSRLDLSVPRRSGVGREFVPTLTGLTVGNARDGSTPPTLDARGSATVRLARPSSRVVLEYDVSGAVRRSDPDTPERALALVTPLVVAQAASLPASVVVPSVKVLNVGCLRGARLTGCGTHTGSGWTVESSGGRDQQRFDVLAQVNLATP